MVIHEWMDGDGVRDEPCGSQGKHEGHVIPEDQASYNSLFFRFAIYFVMGSIFFSSFFPLRALRLSQQQAMGDEGTRDVLPSTAVMVLGSFQKKKELACTILLWLLGIRGVVDWRIPCRPCLGSSNAKSSRVARGRRAHCLPSWSPVPLISTMRLKD